ncbi:MAG: molybdenum cofactor biosynthesis protein MoaE [Planctomycetota bacterium]
MEGEVLLTRAPIDVGAAYEALRDPRCGGIALFVGTTRDIHEGRPVARLAYEAYEEMARRELERLAAELRERWPELGPLRLVHRLGEVGLAEASVLVAVAAPHRAEAFAACRYGIDALKAQVPIWKQESYRDGAAPRWVANRESAVPEADQEVRP